MSASRAAVSRASGGTNKATSVGARTLPKTRSTSSHTKGNIPAYRYWEQGYGTITIYGRRVVPFLSEETCRRIARNAEREMKEPMDVRNPPGTDLWVYRPVDEERL